MCYLFKNKQNQNVKTPMPFKFREPYYSLSKTPKIHRDEKTAVREPFRFSLLSPRQPPPAQSEADFSGKPVCELRPGDTTSPATGGQREASLPGRNCGETAVGPE